VTGVVVVAVRLADRTLSGSEEGREEEGASRGLFAPFADALLATRLVEPLIGLLCVAGSLLLGGLAWYHTLLSLENITSIEEHKRDQQRRSGLPMQPNPFATMSREENCRQALCSGSEIPSAILP
jgi:hypothetical protein